MQEKNDYRFLAGAALLSFSLHAGAAGEGRAEIDAWLNLEPTELPTPGTTITQAEIELVRPLLPPGFIDHVNHPALSLEIQATADYPPHESYLAATAAHAGQASLKAEGGMEGFTAGRPFDPQTFDDVSPEEAGMMIAWNHVYRWQYYGYKLDTLDMTYVQATADGSGGASDQGMEGGGSIERHLVQSYHRVYLNHLAMLPQQDWKVNAGGSDKRYFKDYISFLEPFDVQ
ncbi:MAG: hypothetical protein RL434_1616, partial [Pseudomonadota bacterium]